MDTLDTSRETPAVALEPNVWEETYQIRTFEVDCRNRLSILSMFNFMQYAASKHAQALGVSVCILPFVDRLKPLEGHHVLPDTLEKLPELKNRTYEKKFIARYGDLDVNQHVNNVSFVEWVVEGVPSSLLNTSAPVQLEINFLAEAFYEDCILVACHLRDPDNTVYHHSLTRQADGRELARARSFWRPF
jgi:hypothetical protein